MRNIVLLALACLLPACAQQSQVQLYPGAELPESRELIVEVPSGLEIIDVNGQEVPAANSMFNGDKRVLKLEPGTYRIHAFFKNVYDIGGGISTEVVRTRSAIFSVDGRAGETWRLGYRAPENLEQARELRESFSGWSENLATGERTETQPGGKLQSSLSQLMGSGPATPTAAEAVAPLESTRAPVAAGVAPPAPTAAASLPHNDATLATLQQLWRLLTPESKAAFLEWQENNR
ncbi:DUF2057 family protein [Halopseudomonas nanhaiensis]|uniref:DUF2057 family protein n=1 Tax=Halopseudomonas nanhaiensis TaxID=2830842 RepID=UPI001CBE54F6|nr:DUF2057 family protein [Halopseudomonas nanhaiensis]UAW99783.1 DUF2057 family protein [Halopseudomonas nanhaiensis]